MIPSAAVNHSGAAVVSPATLKNPCLKNHAGSKEADAGHDALDHATRIGAEILIDGDAEPSGRPREAPLRAGRRYRLHPRSRARASVKRRSPKTASAQTSVLRQARFPGDQARG